MRRVLANVLFWSLALAATTRRGLEESDRSSFQTTVPTYSTTEENVQPSTVKHPQQWPTPSPAEINETSSSENVTPPQELKNDTEFDFGLLLQKIRACRKRFPHMSDRKFSFKLYSVLLNELTKGPNKSPSHTFCNISEGLVDGLRDALHKLEFFQGDLLPKNNSAESPGQMENSQQTNNSGGIYSPSNVLMVEVENNLNLNLGEEWIPLKNKFNHLSHIYLGSSLFPLLTEESRRLDIEFTIPTPSTTRKTLLGETSQLKPLSTIQKVYQLLTPVRWHKDKKTPGDLRSVRSPDGNREIILGPEVAPEESSGSGSSSTESAGEGPTHPGTPSSGPTHPGTPSSTAGTSLSTETSSGRTENKDTKPANPVSKLRTTYSDMMKFLVTSWGKRFSKINNLALFD